MNRDYPLMTEDQKSMVYLLRDFLKKEVMPHEPEWEKDGTFPMDVFKKMVDIGFSGIDVPEEYGGMGCDALTTVLLRKELGYAGPGYAMSVCASTFGFKPVRIAGTEEQKKYYGDRIANGGICANCLTEPQSGSDLALTKTKAVRDGDDYIINGTKCFITNGPLANIFTVVASTDSSKRGDGMSIFIVERERPGVSIGKHEDKMGMRVSQTSDVVFEDVRIPAKNLVGGENEGLKIMKKMLLSSRIIGQSMGLGIMERAIDEAIAYAKVRQTFGKPIAKHQMIKKRLADMYIKSQIANDQIYYAANLIDHGYSDMAMGSVTKAFVSESVAEVVDNAMQVMGGYGYMKDYPIEKLYRDARLLQIIEGTNEVQRIVIAGEILNQ